MKIISFKNAIGDKFELVETAFDVVFQEQFVNDFIKWSGGAVKHVKSINFYVPVFYGSNPNGRMWQIPINHYAVKRISDGEIIRIDIKYDEMSYSVTELLDKYRCDYADD